MRNKYIITGETVTIIVNNYKGSYNCYIDLIDLEKLKQYDCTWWARYSKSANTHYATAQINKKLIHMHRVLCDLDDNFLDKVPDHLDHNGLNNRKNNLEVKTKQENHRNIRRLHPYSTSGHRGVSIVSRGLRIRYMAQLEINGKCKSSYHITLEEAVKGRKRLEKIYWNKEINDV